jgi:hypothetical protein
MARVFPSTADYITAIENGQRFVLDPLIKAGKPRRGHRKDPLVYSGGFARVFVIEAADGHTYAFRCWVSDIGDDAHHYKAISTYLARQQLPYFTDFTYLQEGILVNGVKYPTLRMKWVEAPSLWEFIGNYQHRPEHLTSAAENFLRMAQTLHDRKIAHGDLQNDNIKVCVRGSAPDFVLIDYDTLFVPGLDGKRVSSTGLKGFQHPKRTPTAMLQADYFGELVIYLTLHAIAAEPELWDEFGMANQEKQLIFSGEDFESGDPTPRFHRLRKTQSPLVDRLTLILWNATRREIESLIPIETVAEICRSGAANHDWLRDWHGNGHRSVPVVSPTKSKFKDIFKPGHSVEAPPEVSRTENTPGGGFAELLRPRRLPVPVVPPPLPTRSSFPPALPPSQDLPNAEPPMRERSTTILWLGAILAILVLVLCPPELKMLLIIAIIVVFGMLYFCGKSET